METMTQEGKVEIMTPLARRGMNILDWLKGDGHKACPAAREWLATLPDDATMAQAWELCERADWMFWAIEESGLWSAVDDATWRKLACALVRRTPLADGRMVWDLLKDDRLRTGVEVAERYAEGQATAEELAAASDAVNAASDAVNAARDAASAARDAARDAASTAQCAIIRDYVQCPWGEEEGDKS